VVRLKGYGISVEMGLAELKKSGSRWVVVHVMEVRVNNERSGISD